MHSNLLKLQNTFHQEAHAPILFVGSGLSAAQLGFPNWKQLIKELLDLMLEKVPEESASWESFKALLENPKFKFFDALSYIEEYKVHTDKYLSTRLALPKDANLSLFKQLFEISSNIITTNYDTAIETAYEQLFGKKLTPKVYYDSEQKISELRNAKEFIFKIHGSIEKPSDCILYRSQYDSFYTRLSHQFAHQQILTWLMQHTFIFIGFSKNDPDLNLIFDYIARISEGKSPMHFIVTKGEPDYGNQCLPIPLKDWDELPAMLQTIAQLRKEAPTVPISPIKSKGYQLPYVRYSKPVHDLSMEDVMDMRADTWQSYYLERKIDEDIQDLLLDGKSVIIVGDSLAGKTRSVLECLTQTVELVDYTITCFEIDDLPAHFDFDIKANSLFFFDDIDEMVEKPHFEKLLAYIFRKHGQVIATCRIGWEYDSFERILSEKNSKLVEKLNVVKIAEMSEADFDRVPEEYRRYANEVFDGNIGSLFADLHNKRLKYRRLQASKEPLDELCCTILKALKALYFTGTCFDKSTYQQELVRELALRLWLYPEIGSPQEALTNETPFLEKYQLQKRTDFEALYGKALVKLESSTNGLHFIRRQAKADQDLIRIVEVYLEKIVAREDYPSAKINKDIFRLFDKDEHKQFGFFTKLFQFSRLVRQSKSLKEGLEIISQFKQQGIRPDVVTFTSLIPLCRSLAEGMGVVDRMVEAGVERNVVTFTSLIPLCCSLAEGMGVVDRMVEAGVERNVRTFTSLIPLCRSLAEGMGVVDRMVEAGVERNVVTFTSLIPLCGSLAEGMGVVDRMVAEGVERNVVTFTSLIPLCRSLAEGMGVVDRMVAEGVERNVRTFTSLIPLCGSLSEGMGVVDRMVAEGVERNVRTFTSLIPLCGSLAEGMGVVDRMVEAGVERNVVTFNSLVPLCRSLAEGMGVVDRMVEAGVEPDVVTFTSLIPLCCSLAEGMGVVDRMVEEGVERNVRTFTSLIPLCRSLAEGMGVVDRMVEAGVERNVVTFTSLIPLCGSLAEGMGVVDRMVAEGVERNVVTFTSLIPLCGSLAEGMGVVDRMVAEGVERNVRTFTSLIPLCGSLSEGMGVVDRMVAEGVERNVRTFTSLIPLCGSLSEGMGVVDRMVAEGVERNVRTFTSLIPLCRSLAEGMGVVDRMVEEGVEPDVVTFNSLVPLCRSLAEGMGVVDRMVEEGIPLNVKTVGTLETLVKKNPEQGLAFLLKKGESIFSHSHINKLIMVCLKMIPSLADTVLPFLRIIKKQEDFQLRFYAYGFEAIGRWEIAMEIIECFANKGKNYWNIKGNCYRRAGDFKKSHAAYQQSVSFANAEDNNKFKAQVLNNMAGLILEFDKKKMLNDAEAYCLEAMSLVDRDGFPYPFFNYVLIKIAATPIKQLKVTVLEACRIYKINLTTFSYKVLPRVTNEKKRVYLEQHITVL